MENKYVGYLLIAISIVIIINITVFSSFINDINDNSCTEFDCPYHKSFNKMKYLSFATISIILITALILIFSKPEEKIVIKTKIIEKKTEKKILDTNGLKPEEKQILKLIQDSKTIFQAELIEKTSFGKAKMTRIIDRLEGRGFVERKRRGLTNVVVLRE
ncbi:MAG: MarR family transcriptional regulator [Nanoarchaeota archaeon]|mgnify:FL=1